jgi:hypothetical protein
LRGLRIFPEHCTIFREPDPEGYRLMPHRDVLRLEAERDFYDAMRLAAPD